MTVETALYPTQLNTTLPTSSDFVSEGDDHLRLLKTVVKTTFPNVAGAVSASQVELNYVTGVTSGIQAQIDTKGAIAGQTWTGAHVFSGTAAVPTLAQGTNTTGAASTAFVQAEWATRLPNYTTPITASSTELNRLVGVTSGVQSQINAKGEIAGQIWTGTHSFPNTTTVGPLTPTIQGHLSTVTSDVQAQINSKAAKAGDTYTGAHNFAGAAVTVATLALGATGQGAASVDFVNAAAFAAALPGQAGSAGKFITTNGTNAAWAFPFLPEVNVSGTAVLADSGAFYRLSNVSSTTVTLPAAPADGSCVAVFAANRLTTNVISRNGNNLCGLAEDMTIDNPYLPVQLKFRTGLGWDLIL